MENTHTLLFGKMSPAHSPAIKGVTFSLCSKKSQKPKFQCLDLTDGQTPEWYEGGQPTFHGVSWMPNIGEFPSVERESSLWQIIRLNAPQKYSLSQKACQGILRRAANRGKELPKLLRATLEKQSKNVALTDGKTYELGALSRGQGGKRTWDVYPTLREQMGDNLPAVIVLQDKCIGRKEKNTGNGLGVTENGPCYTLTSTDVHAVIAPIMLENYPNDSRVKIDDSGNCQTLTGRMGTGGGNTPMIMIPIYAIDRAAFNQGKNAQYDISIKNDGLMQTIVAKGPNAVGVPTEITLGELVAQIEYIVRRLMPEECAELQGFPADWHKGVKDEKGNEMKDSPAYKGYGNAVATVVAEYPIQNIIKILREEHEQCEN